MSEIARERTDGAVVETEELRRTFGDVEAVRSLSFRVDAGEIFGLVGPDGAGKTTTLRMLASILDPTSGHARVLGHDIVHEETALKDEIGYMSQRFGLYPDLTVLENLLFYADLYGVPRKGLDARVDRLLGFSNMQPFRKRQAGKLSGGMKQKLGLSCALIHAPKLLLLDEPTNGVDPVSRRDFWRILYQLRDEEGVTIVVSTAYLDEAERCDRVALMHEGALVALDTPAAIRGLLSEKVIELRTSDTRRAAKLLREGGVGSSVILFGDRLHLLTDDPDGARAAIEAILDGDGIGIVDLRTVEPMLESIFVSLVGEVRGSDVA